MHSFSFLPRMGRTARARKSGQSLIEYGLLLAFITLVAVGILGATGQSISALLGSITAHLQSAMTATGKPCSTIPLRLFR